MVTASITIVMEFDEPEDTPSGRAVLADGRTREFHGWLGLVQAIDALARRPSSEASTPPAEPKETT